MKFPLPRTIQSWLKIPVTTFWHSSHSNILWGRGSCLVPYKQPRKNASRIKYKVKERIYELWDDKCLAFVALLDFQTVWWHYIERLFFFVWALRKSYVPLVRKRWQYFSFGLPIRTSDKNLFLITCLVSKTLTEKEGILDIPWPHKQRKIPIFKEQFATMFDVKIDNRHPQLIRK